VNQAQVSGTLRYKQVCATVRSRSIRHMP
jgi:hypothetical protein